MNEIVSSKYKFQPFGPYTGLNLVMLFDRKSLFLPRKSVLNDPTDCEPYVLIEDDEASLRAALTKISKTKRAAAFYRERSEELLQALSTPRDKADSGDEADTNAGDSGDIRTWSSAMRGLLSPNPQLESRTFLELFVKSEIGMPRIYSMSARWDITQMWSYYADAHKGYCLELSGLDSTDDGFILDRVNYTDRRAQILVDDVLSLYGSGANARRIVSQIYCEKSNAWREEAEYRVVAREKLVKKERIELSLPGGDFYRFPNMSVNSITFGLRCEKYNMDMVRELVKTHKQQLTLHQVRQ